MNIIAIDDEQLALSALTRAIKNAVPEATLKTFDNSTDLINSIRIDGFYPDIAFMDIEIQDDNGLNLSQLIQSLCPNVNIIFVTGFSQYALDAYSLRPSGYLTKPVTSDDIINEMRNLRNKPIHHSKNSLVTIKCFGNFEIFYKGEPIKFTRSRSKEILAYLVSKQGDTCTIQQIADALWEDGMYDRSRQNQLSVYRHSLIKTLEMYDISNIIINDRNSVSINKEKVTCDYFQLLEGDSEAISNFTGEFMSQYYWADIEANNLYNKYLDINNENG